ncbi:alpha/beta fold hydrolase [Stagnihabitans tardus]|uniref:Alpha/beta fold hydrolase n=1 Tax=Stagnihabitans tardus TaxID=2699202 RepID=A0AAE4Y715_9RHOB|nr:alpha/beta hydrolase [Stagnihabitans tardus]NBZ86998.1 alpha/beta fold hydrolase [Stagnihabitans tardus]
MEFTTGGVRLHYRDEGEGLPVLCLAGLTREGRDFDTLTGLGLRLIRLDSRGRGLSDWTPPYTVPQEAADAVALLDHLGIGRAHVIGASRGGLLGMVMAAQGRVASLCLVDIGPVIERQGLARIGDYLGRTPTSLEAAAEALSRGPGFSDVPMARWRTEAERLFLRPDGSLGLNYDPALREAFLAAFDAPLPDLWPLYDLLPANLAVIRGAGSDLLSAETLLEMQRRRPDLIAAEVPGRGHMPFLDEPEAVEALRLWLQAAKTPVA